MTVRNVFGTILILGLIHFSVFSTQASPLIAHYNRQTASDSPRGQHYNQVIKPIFEHRCAVCHGCYDAPCQLKLTSTEGLERGASKELIYDGTRLIQAKPSRLEIDHQSLAEWRHHGFHPVLDEHQQTTRGNLDASLLYRMLNLKQQQPDYKNKHLPSDVTINIDREYQCPRPDEFDSYARQHPNWGMPYGLPPLTDSEHELIVDWLTLGAPLPATRPLPEDVHKQIKHWESFFNQNGMKAQLVNRYLYEHLFIGALYFDEVSTRHFFRLVRSYSRPGQPIQPIPTRRPYEDPKVKTFYYRLQPINSTRLSKTHMPYALNQQRLQKWRQWFYQDDYQVTELPSYQPSITGNPFEVYQQLPVQSRYRFMLDEAEYTIMGFIKGPVCRGQVALNVINDHFWVFFSNPDLLDPVETSAFLASQSAHLRLPSEVGSTLRPLTRWLKYSSLHKNYLQAQHKARKTFYESSHITLDESTVWNGDGSNSNAALTVFRHFDSASVIKGLVGQAPKTAWIINYPLLERIHYLLVAGFDVYGNIGHQLITRLYMDFLRMEGEMNFLTLLPPETQKQEWSDWYQGTDKHVRDFVKDSSERFFEASRIKYYTDNPKLELYKRLQQRLTPILSQRHALNRSQLNKASLETLQQINRLTGLSISYLPQVVVLSVTDQNNDMHLFTLLHNNAHSNITSLLQEASNRLPERDSLTVANGIVAAYPGAFWHVTSKQLPALVADLSTLTSEKDYQRLMDRFGVRRTNPDFWHHADKVHQIYRQQDPITYGLLDFNRLENR